MNEINKILSIAAAEVGYLEKKTNAQLDDKTANAGYNNWTKYARDLDNIGDFYNGPKNGYAWCDVFVDWCFVQAFGIERALELTCQPRKSCGAGVGYSYNYYKAKGRAVSVPQPGDQIFFKNSSGSMQHTGLVEKVDGTYVYTIEGNTSSASGVVANGGCVARKSYKLSYSLIAGYGRPDYGVDATAVAPVEVTVEEIEQMAKDVIAGKYGNGDERKAKLGDNYAAVQAKVNELLSKPKTETTTTTNAVSASYTNSSLVQYTKLSPHCTQPRTSKIDKITIHHMAGCLSVETCGNIFQTKAASSNYAIGADGRIAMYVEEKDRAWTSSNADNDNRAVTIEVANCGTDDQWPVSDLCLSRLIELCVDICKRNGIEKLNYTGDKTGNLTRHNMFAATACPGPYLQSKFPYIAEEVNKRLSGNTTATVVKPVETTTTTTIKYTVVSGDSLSKIGAKYGVAWKDIATLNGIKGPLYIIYKGQVLNIPITAKVETKKTYSGTFPTLPSRGYFKKGDKGTQVKNLQRLLNWLTGANLSVDGIIGNYTINAVKKFQKDNGLTVDGLFGNKSLTRAKSIKK